MGGTNKHGKHIIVGSEKRKGMHGMTIDTISSMWACNPNVNMEQKEEQSIRKHGIKHKACRKEK